MTFKLVKLETFKYPDAERYFLPVALVSDTPEALILFQPAGAPTWNGTHRYIFRSNDQSMAVLAPGWDYNVVLFWNNDWSFNCYYVNIALPMQWDGELCSYVDLDLDVLYVPEFTNRPQAHYKEPGVYILDRDEYEERSVLYKYPPELMERVEAALQEVLGQVDARAFPFDDSLVNWRPEPEMLSLAELPDNASTWHL